MTDETKELMENARALLAAATPGPWGMGNCLGEPRQLETRLTPLAIFGQCSNAALALFAVNSLPTLCDALAAEMKRADEAEADAAAWRQHTESLIAAMKTWGSWEDGVPAASDGGEYGEVGAAFNAAHNALHPDENLKFWRCSACGETAASMNSSWRWTGVVWQHTHADAPQAGHFDAIYIDAGAAFLARLHAAEDERGLAIGQRDAARANLAERDARLDNQNAGLVTMARERDEARREVEALRAEVERLRAQEGGAA